MTTKIQWTNETWNPVTGCTKISPGCKNCYAERMARRLAGRCGYPEAPHHFDVTLRPDKLVQPLKWRKPRMCFVCSMSDLFHNDMSDDFILRVFAAMALARRHTFQVLTKRPAYAQEFFQTISRQDDEHDVEYYASELAVHWSAHKEAKLLGGTYQLGQYGEFGRCEFPPHYKGMDIPWPLPNVWLGVTAEDQKRADERVPVLLQTPAAVRFVSVEPMLGPVNLSDFLGLIPGFPDSDYPFHRWTTSLLKQNGELLNWVIVGCESGPGRRPCQLAWVRDLVKQCQIAQVPVFVKQLEVNGKVSHDPAEWPEDLRVREWPHA